MKIIHVDVESFVNACKSFEMTEELALELAMNILKKALEDEYEHIRNHLGEEEHNKHV